MRAWTAGSVLSKGGTAIGGGGRAMGLISWTMIFLPALLVDLSAQDVLGRDYVRGLRWLGGRRCAVREITDDAGGGGLR